MKKLATIRIFADHYQFWVYDGDKNPFDPLPAYTDESAHRGWTRSEHAISFNTRADLNDHRLDIFFCEAAPQLTVCERATVHPLKITSRLAVYDTEEVFSENLSKGEYSLVLAAYNLGVQQSPEEDELEDNEFFQ